MIGNPHQILYGCSNLRRMRWEGHVARMGDNRFIQGFGRETLGKEATWKT